jgi:hypothetical protein
MQKPIRAILRWLFGVEALGGLAVAALPLKMFGGHSKALGLGVGFVLSTAATALLFAAGWWTTRGPRRRREYIAALCCVVNIAGLLPLIHYTLLLSGSFAINAVLVALSVAGVFIFLQPPAQLTGRTAQPAYRTPRDCTSRATDLLFEGLMFVAFWQSWRLWDRWAGLHRAPAAPFVPGLLAFGAALIVMIAIHELGHALLGHAVGMKLLSFTVGPFSWRRIKGRVQFKLVLPSLGGSVQTLPLDAAASRQEILVLLGGVLANLCSAPFFVWASLRLRATGPEYAYEFFYCLVVLSIVGGLGNLFPLRIKGQIYSDGAQILQVLTHSPAMDYRRTMQRLQSTLYTPLRLRDLDPAPFQQIAIERIGHLPGLHARICAAAIFNDRGQTDAESAELAEAEACYNNFAIELPALLHTVFISHHAIHHRDAAAARLWWNRMSKMKFDPGKIDTVIAACSLAWLEGRTADAETLWQQADTVAHALPHFGVYKNDRDRVTTLRTILDDPTPPPVISETAALQEFEPQVSASLGWRHALLIAAVSAALLAATMLPAGLSGSLFWHALHGNQTAIGGYKLTLPMKWHPESNNPLGVVAITNSGNFSSGELMFESGETEDEDSDQQQNPQPEDQGSQEAQQASLAANLQSNPVSFTSTAVPLKTRRFTLSCQRMVMTTGDADANDTLYCRVPSSHDAFVYSGPESVEPEARAILTSLE